MIEISQTKHTVRKRHFITYNIYTHTSKHSSKWKKSKHIIYITKYDSNGYPLFSSSIINKMDGVFQVKDLST